MTALRVPVVPPSANFSDWCAGRILELQPDAAPDLSRITILLPSWNGAAAMRRSLVRIHGGPLLGPDICVLRDFADSRASDGPALSALECRLMLTMAVQRHPRLLFPGSDASRIGDALFTLFEEMTAHAADIPDDASSLTLALQAAYGCPSSDWLSTEAKLVFELWRAYLQDSGGRTPAIVYRDRLKAAFEQLPAEETVCLAGFDEFSRCELAAIAPALANGRAHLWLHGRLAGHDGRGIRALLGELKAEPEPVSIETPEPSFLNQAFADDDQPGVSGDETRQPGLSIVEAPSAEAEARCVELAVREAALDGCKDIALITGDRRLARRLRALLERAGLALNDPVGWALSTSSSAALIDAWFDCVEQRFHFRALLKVLRSSFVGGSEDALSFLEQELVFHRKIERDLERFLAASTEHRGLRELLERVAGAARAFQPSEKPKPGQLWGADLIRALQELGADRPLRQDSAGQELMGLIEQLQAAFHGQGVVMDYRGFRDLLSRAVEIETFVPDASPSRVRLLTLDQSHNLQCDRLIVAGASRDGLPGAVPAQPFFNQSVRRELGLADWPARLSVGLARFRRVLEAAPKVLLTYSSESVHDAAQPSPWIEALDAQARRSGFDLRDSRLAQLAGTAAVEVAEEGPAPGSTSQPTPIVDDQKLPDEISASCHQSLIDCPYQFRAKHVLRLRQPESPDEDLRRKDYGEHVHEILCAFTRQVEGRPPPFEKPITAGTREQAQRRLEEIADAVFEADRGRRAIVLSWEAEFREAIPSFLDWLEGRRAASEVHTEIDLHEAIGEVRLKGRLDRLEVLEDGSKVVVDYKTGRVSKEAEVRAGESIQLLHYAALDPNVRAAEFVALKAGERGVRLEENLPELRERAERRLRDTLAAIRHGSSLPANGDEHACKYCDYRGLCRKGDWSDD